MKIVIDQTAPPWAHDMRLQIERALSQPRVLPVHSVSALPPVLPAGQIIRVPDATAGDVIAVSDGTQWNEYQPVGAVS